jgi:glyoxylase-like metal-dependent hydrolase (beta-lactamase superfamily II)
VPHGSVTVGSVEVVALCDGAADYHSAIEVAYPGVPDGAWDPHRARYPGEFATSGTWRLHVHCFVVRSAGRTILVDAGVGPPGAPATGWFGGPGRLPDELRAAEVDPAAVDPVVITHLHDDHIGWNVREGGLPRFPNARYLIPAADWSEFREPTDQEDRAIAEQLLRPLEAAGAVDLVEGEAVITDDVLAFHTPGHTPGHQSVLVASGGSQLLLSGDLTNHPAQLHEPSWAAGSDADPDLARETRVRVLERVEREAIAYTTSHFAEPFGHIRRDGDGWAWLPEAGRRN